MSNTNESRNNRKELVGRVVSNNMQKSLVVTVERKKMHGIYGKFMAKTSRFKAHDENEEANVGDLVHLMETRPLSKNKRWRLVKILERAK